MTAPVYADNCKIYAYVAAGWLDLSQYVVGDIEAEWGIWGNGPLDLVGGTGSLIFTLNNSAKLFTPASGTVVAGWKKGIAVKLVITFENEEYTRWKGNIESINPPSGLWEDWRVRVSCVDWMEHAAKYPIVNPGVLTNQRADDVLRTIVAAMPIRPAVEDYDVGVSLFGTAFDTVTSTTKAMAEFSKVAFSEPGFIYLKKDRLHGETLAFENSQARYGPRSSDQIPLSTEDCDFLLKEDGAYLLKEDGFKVALNQLAEFFADNSMRRIVTEYGENVINRMTVIANPRRVDASAQILFQLDAPVLIGAGQTVELKGSYADPAGGKQVNGQAMIAPVASTDYLMNTSQDGSGTDITADLTVVTGYGTEGFTHQLINGSATYSGWVTKFNCRGYGIYQYNPIEHVEVDADSRLEFGVQSETIDQKYQTDLITGTQYAKKTVELEADPRTVVNEIHFVANRSKKLMMAFLNGDCGLLFRVKADKYDVDALFFVHGVKFMLKPGGYIMFKWFVKQFWEISLGLTPLAIEFDPGETDAINFGYLPVTANLSKRSYSAWIYREPTFGGTIFSPYSDGAGFNIYAGWQLLVGSKVFSTFGNWGTTANVITPSAWHHIVVTFDASAGSSTDPLMYVDGNLEALTEYSTPGGSLVSEDGVEFVLGNIKTATLDYNGVWGGKIKDARVYNRILSADEVTTLYNGGILDTSLLTAGMIFQAFAVRTMDYALYKDQTLNSSMKVLDAVSGAVGTPNASPKGRDI